MRNLLVYFAVLACFSVLVGLPAGSEPNEPRASWSPIESAEPIGIDDWVPPRPECESGSSWTSRHQARTPLSQQDCTHALASVNHKLLVSHRRRGPSDQEFVEDRFGMALPPLSMAPVGESESKLRLSGVYGLWSYETDFDVAREARVDDGRFMPVGRSQLQFLSRLDLGLVRSRVELKGTQREEDRPFARGLAADPGSTSEFNGRAFLDLVVPHLPVVTLGVGTADKEVFRGRREPGEHVDSDVLSATLWYGGKGWQAYAGSSRYVYRDQLRRDAEDGIYEGHYVSGSWWPAAGWTVNPNFQYSESSWDGRESWTKTLRGSLGIYNTGLWHNGVLSLWSGYTQSHDTADYFDYQQFDFAVGVEHTLAELSFLQGYEIAVGSTLGVGQYIDHRYTGASNFGYRANFTIRVGAL